MNLSLSRDVFLDYYLFISMK